MVDVVDVKENLSFVPELSRSNKQTVESNKNYKPFFFQEWMKYLGSVCVSTELESFSYNVCVFMVGLQPVIGCHWVVKPLY